jgi:hypothetical protein
MVIQLAEHWQVPHRHQSRPGARLRWTGVARDAICVLAGDVDSRLDYPNVAKNAIKGPLDAGVIYMGALYTKRHRVVMRVFSATAPHVYAVCGLHIGTRAIAWFVVIAFLLQVLYVDDCRRALPHYHTRRKTVT